MERFSIFLRLVRIPLDFAAVMGAFALAYFIRSYPSEYLWFLALPHGDLLPWNVYFPFMFQAGLLLVVYFFVSGLYSLRQSRRFSEEMVRVMGMLLVWLMTIIFYFFLIRIAFFSRLVLMMGFGFSVFFIAFIRLILSRVQWVFWKRRRGCRRLVFLGQGKVVEDLLFHWQRDVSFEIVGAIQVKNRLHAGLSPLGEVGGYQELLQAYRIDEVVQVERVSARIDEEIVEFCQFHHIEYRFVPDLLEVQRTNFDLDFVGDVPVITLRSSRLNEWGRVLKRGFDFFVSLVLIVLLSPLFFLVALLVKLDSKGAVFYRSQRVSKNKEIGMYKFRSMVVDADSMKDDLKHLNRRSGPMFKVENDPRITRLGRLIRRWSIDELPQLFNVLLGDISLVGPRAHLPDEIAEYEKHHRKVLVIKAGVTGLPQISGRSHLDFEREVKLDAYYIDHWSMWLDLWILWRTVWVVMEGKGE